MACVAMKPAFGDQSAWRFFMLGCAWSARHVGWMKKNGHHLKHEGRGTCLSFPKSKP
jgi:hypothetical protein